MNLEQRAAKITEQITATLAEERETGNLEMFVATTLAGTGEPPSHAKITELVRFVEGYVKQVPYLMIEGLKAAQAVGLGEPMEYVMGEAVKYWDEPNDLIPDRLGLVGLMDDAYYSLALIQVLSERCESENGVPLLVHPLARSNQLIRGLIGERVASELDQLVQQSFALEATVDAATRISSYGGDAPLLAVQPTYAETDTGPGDEIGALLAGAGLYLPEDR